MRFICLLGCLLGCTTAVPDDAAPDADPVPMRRGPCVPACGPGLVCDAAAGVCRLVGEAGPMPEPEPAPAPEGEPEPATTDVVVDRYATTADLRDGDYPTHIAHLIGRTVEGFDIALVYDLVLANLADRPRELDVRLEVEGFGEPYTQTVVIGSRTDTVAALPAPLDLERLYRLDAPAEAVLRLSVSEGDAVLTQDARAIRFVPPQQLWWVIETDQGPADLRPSVATHIQPDDPAVQRLLGAVAARTAAGRITGYDTGDVQAVADQVAAVYGALQSQGMRLERLPAGYFFEPRQVRLPGAVLAANQGDAMEGVVLFASIFEAMGLIPIVSYGASHVLVGVRQAPQSDRAWMVETTGLPDQTAQAAMDAGVAEQNRWVEVGDEAFLPMDVALLRELGWVPMPILP